MRILYLTIVFTMYSFSAAVTAQDLKVFASNYPLNYFAERISGNSEVVVFPEIEGDPAFWEPDLENIMMIQSSDVILLNGADYEKWLTTVSLPKRKIINTSKVFKEQFLTMEESVDHAHGPGGEHSHSGTAFTTWIDFNQAAFQAKAIKDALEKQNVLSNDLLEKNFESLIEDLKALDTEINEMAVIHPDILLMASHPVYQYFARRYGLNIKAVMWEPEVFPDGDMWKQFEQIIEEHPAKWMIWEGEPLQSTISKN